MIRLGKETSSNLQSLSVFNNAITNAAIEGFVVKVDTAAYNVKTKLLSYSLDRKAANYLFALWGAYCDLCKHSKQECSNVELVESGFLITRDLESITRVFDELQQDDGTIRRLPNDYNIREGVVGRPIATNQACSVQVLHGLMRTFDFYMKVAVHIKAEVFQWSESPTSRYRQFLAAAKSTLQDKLKSLGIKWDFPDSSGCGGTTTTG